MSNNPFVLPKEEYKRDIDVMRHYLNQSALYLSKMTSRPYEECEEFVRRQIRPGGQFEFKDPKCLYTERGENGDRELVEGGLYKYLTTSIRENDLIAPTLTTYLPPSKKKSLLVDFIDGNVKARGVAKKAMFAAEVAGDMNTYTIKKIEQNNKKLSNNSISGAHVSASTPLYNRTAHSTLTSNCRSTSGYGNANNEKFLSGNRHYWSPDIVRNNITSIIANSDYYAIRSCMEHYGIRAPSVQETMECILYSSDLYWTGHNEHRKLFEYVSKLTEFERAAFVYTGDLYHLMKYNDDFVRGFITKMAMRLDTLHPDPDAAFNSTGEDIHNLASQICAVDTKGTSIKKLKGTEAYARIAATVQNIQDTINEYSLLIKTFWVTSNVPASLSYFPESIRRSALTSDTDSTIFTVQDWRKWHQGSYAFTDEAYAVDAVMVFLASQTIIHVLARMSANFGIETQRIHQIAMKNEFKFDVFVPTQVAKHYYAIMSCQEGNVFAKYKNEIKGVHLKSSNVSRIIMKRAEAMMEKIMFSVVDGKNISARELLKEVADIEREIMESIRKGDSAFFRRGLIKSASSYIEKEKAAPYQQYVLWDSVFAPKYGSSPPLPYMSVKVSVGLDTAKKTEDWLASFDDPELANRVKQFLAAQGKRHIGSTMQLPMQNISSNGLPPEILAAMSTRSIVLDNCKVFYLVLESLGIYVLNSKLSRLLSDEY